MYVCVCMYVYMYAYVYITEEFLVVLHTTKREAHQMRHEKSRNI
jgi:hypothetical protein